MSLDAPWRPALASARLTRPASTLLKPRSACDPSDRRIGRSNFLQLLGATGAALFAGSRRCRAEDDLKMQLNKDFSCGGLDLENPRFLGGGVQGEVYQADLPGTGLVAVKISRRNDDYAKGTFAREQQVVKLLSDAQVPGVERCIAAGPVVTLVGQRQGLVMQPCLPAGKVISVKSGRGTPLFLEEDKRMEKLMKTAVRVLDAGVAGVDVQVLQDANSQEQAWIDFTEAAILRGEKGNFSVEAPVMVCPEYASRYKSAKDAVVGFATEVFLLVPATSRQLAAEALASELELLAQEPSRGVGQTFQDVWAKLPWRCEPLTQGRLEAAAERCAEVQMRSA